MTEERPLYVSLQAEAFHQIARACGWNSTHLFRFHLEQARKLLQEHEEVRDLMLLEFGLPEQKIR